MQWQREVAAHARRVQKLNDERNRITSRLVESENTPSPEELLEAGHDEKTVQREVRTLKRRRDQLTRELEANTTELKREEQREVELLERRRREGLLQFAEVADAS